MIDKCSLCDSEIDQDAGDIKGCIGIIQTNFCIWCYSGIHDMIIKMNGYDDPETLKTRIEELEEENEYRSGK